MIKYHERTDGLYVSEEDYTYWSPRYQRAVHIPRGTVRDGASGAIDVKSSAWWVHDQLCADGTWYDGSDVTPWQAATVLKDILKEEGFWFRQYTWWVFTYMFGCKRAHDILGH